MKEAMLFTVCSQNDTCTHNQIMHAGLALALSTQAPNTALPSCETDVSQQFNKMYCLERCAHQTDEQTLLSSPRRTLEEAAMVCQ